MVYKNRMESRRFVIPDIHGCELTLRRLLEKIELRKSDYLYFLGDLIDRGPRSKEVLDLLLYLIDDGYNINSVRGNHEQMLLDSGASAEAFRLWLVNGGYTTLDSFGRNRIKDIPGPYIDFINSFPNFIELEDFVLVHGGLNFNNSDPFADTWAMLWSRSEKVDRRHIGNRRIICGHTPHTRDTIRRSLGTDLIMIDNGCVFREQPGLGKLTALELNSMELTFQGNID